MNTLLVVEDDPNTSEMLRDYFEIVGYEVVNALTGVEAIRVAKDQQPTVIILDIILPDMDGYEVCKQLRSDETTDQIPIIFLTQKDERRDRLDGLSLGADDYITKPFDMDELRLRVHNIIDRMGGTSLVDARTGLPSQALIKERLPRLLENPDSVYLEIEIEQFESFTKKYGPVAGNQVIRSAAKIMADLLHEIDPVNSFIGHPGDNHFLIALRDEADVRRLESDLPKRFSRRVDRFYDYEDSSRGEMEYADTKYPLMTFDVKTITAEEIKKQIDSQPQTAKSQKKTKSEKPRSKKKKAKDDKKASPQAKAKVKDDKKASPQAKVEAKD